MTGDAGIYQEGLTSFACEPSLIKQSVLSEVRILFHRFARRRTDGLGFSEYLACTQQSSNPMFATQETRHGRSSERCGRLEGGTRYFGLVTQSVVQYLGLGVSSCHDRYFTLVDLTVTLRGAQSRTGSRHCACTQCKSSILLCTRSWQATSISKGDSSPSAGAR